MKKIVILLFLLTTFIPKINAMLPGPARIVSCPHCGEEKKLMTLLSGNTFEATQWSDVYQYAPMMPTLSPVQKCGKCGNYFMLGNEEPVYDDDNHHCMATGRLSYPEIKQAILILEDSGLSKNEEISLRLEFLHRYNDAYRTIKKRSWEKDGKEDNEDKTRDETDLKLHQDNLKKLISLLDRNEENICLIGEFYREAGNFEECIALLEGFNFENEFLKNISDMIIEKAKAGETEVFTIYEN